MPQATGVGVAVARRSVDTSIETRAVVRGYRDALELGLELLDRLAHGGGQSGWAQRLAVEAGVLGVAFGQKRLVRLAANLILETKCSPAEGGNPRRDRQEVVEPGRRSIAAVGPSDRGDGATLFD